MRVAIYTRIEVILPGQMDVSQFQRPGNSRAVLRVGQGLTLQDGILLG